MVRLGYVLRMEDTSDCIIASTWRPGGRRTTWRTVEKERNKLGWNPWNQAKHVARNRELHGKNALQPYGPRGSKRIDEVR